MMMTLRCPLLALLLLQLLNVCVAQDEPCVGNKIPFDSLRHKSKYRVAIDGTGFERSMRLYNTTFAQYLTATAGKRFDPPITFELYPTDYNGLMEAVQLELVDFFYSNPGTYSCVGVEKGAQPLATTIFRKSARGHAYNLDVYGGVMFSMKRKGNKARKIEFISDIKDTIIGAGAITDTMGGQAQFYEMIKVGMSYVMDPKQVVFTGDPDAVVRGVMSGEFDVGMVRTSILDDFTDENGTLIDPDIFEIIDPEVYVLEDGTLFPFLHSTAIYPEWPFASTDTTASDVSFEVQAALDALALHAKPWEAMIQCQRNGPSQVTLDANDSVACDAAFWEAVERCDTTPEIAELAFEGMRKAGFAGFRAPRSYFGIRTMQERAGFIRRNEQTDSWKCVRADSLYDSIRCPENHYKLSEADFELSCAVAGLECKPGYECYCRPCVEAFEVDVYQYFPEIVDASSNADVFGRTYAGCDKMTLCGSGEQLQPIIVRVVDNQERENATFTAKLHLGRDSFDIEVYHIANFTHEMVFSGVEVGVGILEVSINGNQIPESPVRIEVLPRNCGEEFGSNREANDLGVCVCQGGHVEISGSCVTTTVLAITISIIALIGIIIVGYFAVQHQTYKNDLLWHVNPDELKFGDPAEIIGEGAFGVVILAEYRGTKVAIKRAVRSGGSSRGSASRSGIDIGGKMNVADTAGETVSALSPPPVEDSGYASNGLSLILDDDDDDESPPKKPADVESQIAAAKASGSIINSSDGMNPPRGRYRGSVMYNKKSRGSRSRSKKGKGSGYLDLGFLTELYGKKNGRKGFANDQVNEALSIVASGSVYDKPMMARLFPCLDSESKREQAFLSEMRLLSSLRHPNICTVMGAVVSREFTPMLVMEYMDYGSLNDLLQNETMYLSGEIILQITRDVAQGLRYLHTAKPPILHGDLKPANILIDSRFRAKVCDFGLSLKKKDVISGSLLWLPPEYLVGNEEYSPKCDMYSMGIILNEIYARVTPYKGQDCDLKTLLIEICDRRVNRRPTMPETVPPRMVELVKKLWSRDPNTRPTAKDLDRIMMDFNVTDVEPLTSEQLRAKPRTQDMIYEIFPRHIAEALKAGKKVEPESHELVTVLFSDIKGFTDISREISPMKVSEMLDRLYLAFDRIARKHGVFKVETIGDAYMGVTNLVEKQAEDHVKRIAEFAIDMINEAGQILIDEDAPEKGFIRIRVGFHSGPVVANVIGSLNPRYGLFGDTVNTASRMESNSAGSRILCSETSYMLLKRQAPNMPACNRGKIQVKGKGDMVTYWVGDELIRQNKKTRRSVLIQRAAEKDPLKPAPSFGDHDEDDHEPEEVVDYTNPKVLDNILSGGNGEHRDKGDDSKEYDHTVETNKSRDTAVTEDSSQDDRVVDILPDKFVRTGPNGQFHRTVTK